MKTVDLKYALGVVDIPEKQVQEELIVDVVEEGNLALFASSGFGKSFALETIVLSLAIKNNPNLMQFYILDFGNSTLIPLRGLPHVADYIVFDDQEKIIKFIEHIETEVKERKQKLADSMLQSVDLYNQMNQDKQIPAIMIVVDNYDVVKEIPKIDLDGFITRISRDGVSLGIYFSISASRMAALKYSMQNNFRNKIAFYNYDENEVRSIVGRGPYKLPEQKGRAMVKGEYISIMQVYSIVPFENDLEYVKNFQSLIQGITEASSVKAIKGIAVLPDQLFASDLDQYEGYEGVQYPLGLDEATIEVSGVNQIKSPFLIYGPSQSGKTNALSLMLSRLSKANTFIFDNATLSLYGHRQNHVYVTDEIVDEVMDEILSEIMHRKEMHKKAVMNDTVGNPKLFFNQFEPFTIVIEEVDEWIEKMKARKEILGMLNDSAAVGIQIIVTSTSNRLKGYDEVTKFFKATQDGLLLGAQANAVFQNVPRDVLSIGYGYLYLTGTPSKIKVAHMSVVSKGYEKS